LPYTKRGRRAQVLPDHIHQNGHSSDGRESTEDMEDPSPQNNAIAGSSDSVSPILQHSQEVPTLNQLTPPQTFQNVMSLYPTPPPPSQQQQQPQQSPQLQHHPQPPAVGPPPPPNSQLALNEERWERMAVLFRGVREHARTFEYPSPSVATLETILVRLYLETPVNMTGSEFSLLIISYNELTRTLRLRCTWHEWRVAGFPYQYFM
jgi:hypothetical protein